MTRLPDDGRDRRRRAHLRQREARTSRSSPTSSSSPRSRCAPLPAGEAAPLHVHARHAEAVFVLEGELDASARGSRASGRPRDLGVRPARGRAHVRGDGRRAGAVPRPPRSGLGLRRLRPRLGSRRSTSGPRSDAVARDPGLVVVRRAGGSEGDTITDRPGRRATVLVEADELTISEFALRPGRARRAAARPPRARGRVPRRRGRVHVPPARRLARPSGRDARRLPARRRPRLRQRLERRIPRAASTSTCRRPASPTTCAGGTPTSTSSTRRRTAASTLRPLSQCASRSRFPA